MALAHNLQEVQFLRLASHIHDLRLVIRGVHFVDLDQVPQVVVRPVQLGSSALQPLIYICMRQQPPKSLRTMTCTAIKVSSLPQSCPHQPASLGTVPSRELTVHALSRPWGDTISHNSTGKDPSCEPHQADARWRRTKLVHVAHAYLQVTHAPILPYFNVWGHKA